MTSANESVDQLSVQPQNSGLYPSHFQKGKQLLLLTKCVTLLWCVLLPSQLFVGMLYFIKNFYLVFLNFSKLCTVWLS